MCGIVAYAGSKPAADVVYKGLERLEYRGYDSAGISTLCKNQITTVKHGGRVNTLFCDLPHLKGSVGIGHTRWATHGVPNDANAHPHASGAFSVVHNGIIENWRELKEKLESSGAVFLSETDSEVVAKLLDHYYDGDLFEAVKSAVSELKGSFALAILCRDFDGFIAVKSKSSLVIGYGKDGNFAASDIPALYGKAEKISVPDDGDFVFVTAERVIAFDSRFNEKQYKRLPANADSCEAEKGDYPYFMIKEIREAERTVKAAVLSFTESADKSALLSALKEADKIIITGCGTAYNSGLAAKSLFSSAGIDCTVEIASEMRYYPPNITPRTAVIAVSQSGETADTVEAARLAKSLGATVVAVTNVKYSAITGIADITVPLCAGAEICVAATKSYIGQLTCFYLLAALISGGESACRAEAEELIKTASLLDGVAYDEVSGKSLAAACKKSSAVFFIGRGLDYAAAVEGSLKLKEVSYLYSDGYPSGELKHGTLALVDENTLGVCLICDERTAEKCENAVEQITSRKGRVAVITTLPEVAKRAKADAEFVWELPHCPTKYSPFFTAVALQLAAYETAVSLGRDPDKPRNLAKSVTVE